MKNNIKFILILLFATGCNTKEVQNSGTIFKIDLDSTYDTTVLDSVYSKVEIIQLQTKEECLLAKPSQMIMGVDSSLIILDEINKSIYRFDKSGKFLNSIGQKGKGPGEYIIPRTIVDIAGQQQIVVGDIGNQKLIYYNYNGKLIEERKINYSYRRLIYNINNQTWWGYAGDARRIHRELDANQRLKFINLANDIDDGVRFVYGHKSYGHTLCDAFKCFPGSYELCYFHEPFNNNIYTFDGEKIKTKYTFDFGKYNPIAEEVDDYILEDKVPTKWLIKKAKLYVSSFNGFTESEKNIYLSFFHNSRHYSFSINKSNKKANLLEVSINQQDNENRKISPLFFPHIAYSSNICFSIVSAYEMRHIAKEFNIKENDNPIVIKYLLR